MRNIPTDLIKSFLRDRLMVSFTALLLLITFGYIVYVALALEPSDLQVATRYTAFGDTHFYRDKWYYLLSFILFGIMLGGVHIALAIKLYGRERRQLAVGLLIFTIFLFIIGSIITRSILRIAFL